MGDDNSWYGTFDFEVDPNVPGQVRCQLCSHAYPLDSPYYKIALHSMEECPFRPHAPQPVPHDLSLHQSRPQGVPAVPHGLIPNQHRPQAIPAFPHGLIPNQHRPQAVPAFPHGLIPYQHRPQAVPALPQGLNPLPSQVVPGVAHGGLNWNQPQPQVVVASISDFWRYGNQYQLSLQCHYCNATRTNATYEDIISHISQCRPHVLIADHFKITQVKCTKCNGYYSVSTPEVLHYHSSTCQPQVHIID